MKVTRAAHLTKNVFQLLNFGFPNQWQFLLVRETLPHPPLAAIEIPNPRRFLDISRE